MDRKQAVEEFGTNWIVKFFGLFLSFGAYGLLVQKRYIAAAFSVFIIAHCLHSKVFVMPKGIRYRFFGPFSVYTPLDGYKFGEDFFPFGIFGYRGREMRPIFFRFIHRDYKRFCELIEIPKSPLFGRFKNRE